MSLKTGLSLSGGGYRAAAFHLGTLKKLHEMAILPTIDVLSTISGGSITGVAWCLHKGDYTVFHENMRHKLEHCSVINRILRSLIFIRLSVFVLLFLGGSIYLTLTDRPWLSFPLLLLFFVLLLRFQYLIFPVSNVIEKAYDDFFFEGKKLDELENGRPVIAIGSSNLHTGRPFTFSQHKMSDSSYSFRLKCDPPVTFLHKQFPVARAVMASSCVPFAFSPVTIAPEFYADAGDVKRARPVLVDGGVYDNQGIHKLAQAGSSYACDIIITSDAGGRFIADKRYPNAIMLLIRTVDLFMYRIKAVQMQTNVYRNVQSAERPIAYFSLGWRLEELIPGFIRNMIDGQVLNSVLDAHDFDPLWRCNPERYKDQIKDHLKARTDYEQISKGDLTEEEWQMAGNTGTSLQKLSRRRIDCLIRQAENLTELQVKLYCPSLFFKPGKN